MSPRTLIRHKDIRLVTQDLSAPDVEKSENDYARGRYFEANCNTTDIVGDFVFIDNPPSGGLFSVTRVDLVDPTTFPAIGVIVEKTTATQCFVQRSGIINVSTFASAIVLTPGDKYWIGVDGQLSDAIPVPFAGLYVIQLVGQALSATELLLSEGVLPIKRRA